VLQSEVNEQDDGLIERSAVVAKARRAIAIESESMGTVMQRQESSVGQVGDGIGPKDKKRTVLG
jgi:hypothetical protein